MIIQNVYDIAELGRGEKGDHSRHRRRRVSDQACGKLMWRVVYKCFRPAVYEGEGEKLVKVP